MNEFNDIPDTDLKARAATHANFALRDKARQQQDPLRKEKVPRLPAQA